MTYQIAIFCALLIMTAASAQTINEKPTLPKQTPAEWTFEKYIEYLWTHEDFLNCDRSDHDETYCLKLDVRKEMASVTASIVIDDPDFDNKDYLIEYSVDRYGVVLRIHTFNSSGLTQLESFKKCVESLNPIRRKAQVNNSETRRLATIGVVDYFEIHDGKVIIPESGHSK